MHFLRGEGTDIRPREESAGTEDGGLGTDPVNGSQLILPGRSLPGHARTDPAVLADTLWGMHTKGGGFRHFADDLDA